MMRAINLFRLTEIFTIWLQVEELNIILLLFFVTNLF